MKKATLRILILGLALAVAGCSGYRTYRKAQIAEQRGDWDQAVLYYLEALEDDPGNISYRTALLRAKLQASQAHFEKGKEYRDAGVLERALVEFQQAVQLDPTNQYAMVEMDKVREELAAARRREEAPGSLDQVKEQVRRRSQPPVLNPRSEETISLDFPEPVSIMDIYRALGKAFGINILFDPNLRDQKIAIELQDVTAQDALEILMRTAGQFYKVLDEQTIIIADDNVQNRRAYEDLVIQTFFLSNAEVKDVMTMLRSLIGAKNIAANEQLNAIILRDTADKVKVAERIILANDKSRGEVVIDVELLQINTSKLRELGVSLSNYQITQRLDLGGEEVPIRLSDLEFINQNNWILTIPTFIYDFVKSSTDAQLLAKPQLRISDGQKARLHIGDRVPIPVTTFNTAQTVGGNIVPITSFQYQDVGIRIEIEPRIHHNQEITLVLKVEVSNLAGFVGGGVGQTQQPIIGTRTIESTIRLKDGETNLLAGLIRTDESNSEQGVPGLSEIPVLGRLFSKTRTDNQRTDVVLTLTPHIIRTSDITEEDLVPIWVGTEANITFRGGSPRVESDVEGPFEEGQATPEQIQEMIRRRIQNLPRGLRQAQPGAPEAGEGEAPSEEAPPGVDLVPPSPPTDLFAVPEEPPEEEEGEEEKPEEEAPPGAAALAPAGRTALAASGEGPGDSPPAAELRLAPEQAWVAPGVRFVLELRARARSPLSHLPLELAFDPELLAAEGVERGEFLGQAAEVLADASRPGRLLLGASRLGRRPGVRGEGVVALLRFRALGEGIAEVRFVRAAALGPELEPLSRVEAAAARIHIDRSAAPARPGRQGPPPEA